MTVLNWVKLSCMAGLAALLASCGGDAGEHGVSGGSSEWSGVPNPTEGYYGLDAVGPAGSQAVYSSADSGAILRVSPAGNPEWLLTPKDDVLKDPGAGPALCLAPADSLLAAYGLSDDQGRTSLALSRIDAAAAPLWSRLYTPPAESTPDLEQLDLEQPALARQTFRGQSFCATLASTKAEPLHSGLALISLDANGVLLWDEVLLLKGLQTDYSAPRLALDTQGNVYVVVSLDEGLLLCSFERSGKLRWARRMLARDEAANSLQLGAVSVLEGEQPAVLVCGYTPSYSVPLAGAGGKQDFYRAGFALSASLDGELNWAVVESESINLLSGIVVDNSGPTFISYFYSLDSGKAGILAQRFAADGALASAWIRPGRDAVLPYLESSVPIGGTALLAAVHPLTDAEPVFLPGSALDVLGPWERFDAVRNAAAGAELLPVEFENRPIGGLLQSAQYSFSKQPVTLAAAVFEGEACLTRLNLPPAK